MSGLVAFSIYSLILMIGQSPLDILLFGGSSKTSDPCYSGTSSYGPEFQSHTCFRERSGLGELSLTCLTRHDGEHRYIACRVRWYSVTCPWNSVLESLLAPSQAKMQTHGSYVCLPFLYSKPAL